MELTRTDDVAGVKILQVAQLRGAEADAYGQSLSMTQREVASLRAQLAVITRENQALKLELSASGNTVHQGCVASCFPWSPDLQVEAFL